MDVINNAIKAIWLSGFAQCGLRFDYVEGTDSSPVGYLEGIFVLEEYKKRGYAKENRIICFTKRLTDLEE